ncbi:MAG: branched-chain amino acid ABC transporter permease [Anaerolineae bacterium]|nr:branched-chain amino acid ABC transporter permease [Anaerolineae bacterium]
MSVNLQRAFPVAALILPLLLLAGGANLLGNQIFERIVTVMFINLTVVLGLQMFIGNSGVSSFVHIGFMGIGAYASILFSMSPQDKALALRSLYEVLKEVQLPFLPSLLIGAGVAALVAAVIGFPLMRLSGAGAVIATFALLVIIHVIFINWEEVTNGPRTIFGITRYTNLWVSAAWGFVFILLAYGFKETGLGLRLRASREDERAAASLGIDIVWVRWVAFVLSAFVVGVGGALYAHFITSFSPLAFYLTQTFLVIAMLIIGGTGSVAGAVVGTVVVTAIFEGLRAAENAINLAQLFPETLAGFTEVCLSIAMILILIYRPAGIMGGQEFRWPRK